MAREDKLFRDQVRQAWGAYDRAVSRALSKAWIEEDKDLAADAAASRRYRAKFLTASESLTRTTHWECIADRVRAVVHALLRVDRLYDPISEYEARLSYLCEVWRRRANGALKIRDTANVGAIENGEVGDGLDPVEAQTREDGTPITDADRLRADIARLQDVVGEFKIEEPAESASFAALEDAARKAADYAQSRCSEYEQALARPSYRLDYDDMFRRAQSAIPKERSRSEADENTARRVARSANEAGRTLLEKIGEVLRDGWEEFVLLFKDPLSSSLFWVVFPAEILFTLPAFQVMMPKETAAAYAAAIIYTSVLIGLAAATWIIFRQGFEWPAPQSPTGGKPVVPKGRPRPLTLLFAAGVCVLGIVVCVWGADLRGRVPEANALLRIQNTLEEKLGKPDAKAATVSEANANQAARSHIHDDLAAIEASERKLLEFRPSDLKIGSVLQAVSLAIYLGLFILVIARLRAEVDPYPNYELWSEQLRSARMNEWGLKFGREIGKGLMETGQKEVQSRLHESLRERRTALGLLAPDDPHALVLKPAEPKTQSKSGDVPAKSAAGAADDAMLKRLGLQGHVGKLWVRDRLRRYTRTYCYIAGRRLIAAHGKSVAYALNQVAP